jgi:mannose-6-phosphate isomerase
MVADAENMDDGLYRLLGQIQHYAWGGHEFIPNLLGLHPEPHTPYAEYWLGAHAKAPSKIILEENRAVPLDKLIAENPHRVLGPRVALKYGQLPYLFKVLDVEDPLSIQVHPTKLEAEAGFEKENELGIPLDSPERNYKDRNHKPELMVALGDFWLLHGFLPEAKLLNVLRDVPEFHVLLAIFEKGGHAGLYRHVMNLPAEEVDAILAPLVARIRREDERRGLEKSSAEYWVVRVAADGNGHHYDRGLFSICFLNLVTLRRGQAIFQDAGIPHAYLQGQNIEVMANSDNVLRGGLTEKHVDVPELLSTVRFEGIRPLLIEGTPEENPLEAYFESPTQDFRLSHIHLGKGDTYVNSTQSIEILLIMYGVAAIQSGRKRLSLRRGQSAVVFAGSTYRIEAFSEGTALYRVSLP